MEAAIRLRRWTRGGLVSSLWNPFETDTRLVFDTELRDRIQRMSQVFLQSQDDFHRMKLVWRRGVFIYGPPGCGKSALSRGIAQQMGWTHISIPGHEILDSHLLEQALAECTQERPVVLVLEDVDDMLRKMDPYAFFQILDNWMIQSDGVFWVSTTRRPEMVPKAQLVRPGRFDEWMKLSEPTLEIRRRVLEELMPEEVDRGFVHECAIQMSGLTYSHLEELRHLLVRLRIESKDSSAIAAAVTDYLDTQLIAKDRWGGLNDASAEVEERVKHVDSRILLSALDLTDVFKRLMEKVITDAFAKAQEEKAQGEGQQTQ